jgi:hypothetical protein
MERIGPESSLKAVHPREIDIVIVGRPDWRGRLRFDRANTIRKSDGVGADVDSLIDALDPITPSGLTLVGTMTIFLEFGRKTLRECAEVAQTALGLVSPTVVLRRRRSNRRKLGSSRPSAKATRISPDSSSLNLGFGFADSRNTDTFDPALGAPGANVRRADHLSLIASGTDSSKCPQAWSMARDLGIVSR